jgi:hypothetical protein
MERPASRRPFCCRNCRSPRQFRREVHKRLSARIESKRVLNLRKNKVRDSLPRIARCFSGHENDRQHPKPRGAGSTDGRIAGRLCGQSAVVVCVVVKFTAGPAGTGRPSGHISRCRAAPPDENEGVGDMRAERLVVREVEGAIVSQRTAIPFIVRRTLFLA